MIYEYLSFLIIEKNENLKSILFDFVVLMVCKSWIKNGWFHWRGDNENKVSSIWNF